MLWHIIERVKHVKLIDEIIVATTKKRRDESIVKLSEESNVKAFTGSEEDALDRFFQAATKYKAGIIVRITADCPLIDPEIVDKVIKYFLDGDLDYVSNVVRRTYPDGLDTEVFSYDALKKAWNEARLASERENVTPYVWNHPEIFRIGSVEHERDFSQMRWCVDTDRDLKFVREIYKQLYKEGRIFRMKDILELLKKHPELMGINKEISTNEGYAKSLREDRLVR